MNGQILIWERGTRLEAGIKRELFRLPSWPEIRACRSARDVLEKRLILADAVLVLDATTAERWITDEDANTERVRQLGWRAVIAAFVDRTKVDWQWSSCGISAALPAPIHDRTLAQSCLNGLFAEPVDLARVKDRG